MHIRNLSPILLLAVAGCGGPGSATIADAPGDDDDSAIGDDDDDDAGPPTFERDIIPLFERSCGAGDNNCHSQIAFKAEPEFDCKGWLSLENMPLGSSYEGVPTGCPDMDLYERLLDLGSWQCFTHGAPDRGVPPTEWKYVVPFDLDASYLWHKITIGTGVLCHLGDGNPSDYMPIAVDLPQEDIDLVEAWILGGALRYGDTPTGGTTSGDVNCTITSPVDGDAFPFYESITVTGTCMGGAALDWSMDTQAGSLGTAGSVAVTLPADGANVITLSGIAGAESAQTSITLTSVSPVVVITHPGDGDVRSVSDGPFLWSGQARDRQDGELSASIFWWSTIDQEFGRGASFDSLLSVGQHQIWAEVVDVDGNFGSAIIDIEMTP